MHLAQDRGWRGPSPSPCESRPAWAVRIEDTRWRAVEPDAPRGSRVCVTGVEGNTLQVAPLEEG